jgi:hypothetical protein
VRKGTANCGSVIDCEDVTVEEVYKRYRKTARRRDRTKEVTRVAFVTGGMFVSLKFIAMIYFPS